MRICGSAGWIGVRPTQQIEQLFIQLEKTKAQLAQVPQPGFIVAVESYRGQDLYHCTRLCPADVFDDLNKEYNVDAALEFHPRFKDKIERIVTLDAPIKNGWLAFHENLNEEILEGDAAVPEFSDFIDGVDALQGATELVCYGVPEETVDMYGEPVEGTGGGVGVMRSCV